MRRSAIRELEKLFDESIKTARNEEKVIPEDLDLWLEDAIITATFAKPYAIAESIVSFQGHTAGDRHIVRRMQKFLNTGFEE